MPSVAREQAFFSTIFGLDATKKSRDREAINKYVPHMVKQIFTRANSVKKIVFCPFLCVCGVLCTHIPFTSTWARFVVQECVVPGACFACDCRGASNERLCCRVFFCVWDAVHQCLQLLALERVRPVLLQMHLVCVGLCHSRVRPVFSRSVFRAVVTLLIGSLCVWDTNRK